MNPKILLNPKKTFLDHPYTGGGYHTPLPPNIHILYVVLYIFKQIILNFKSFIVFIVDPVSVAAIDGTTVEFTCTANNTGDLSFRVNDLAISQSVIKKGFQQQPVAFAEELGNMVLRRNLTVTISSLYNNTDIYCEADGSPMDVESKKTNLTIQGLREIL